MDVMLIQSWYYQLLRTIPEGIAMVALGTAFVKARYSWRQILSTGLLASAIVFLLQQLPIKYGAHIPLGIITFMLILNLVLKLNLKKSAAATLFSFILLNATEVLLFIVQTKLLGYTEEMLIEGTDLARLLFSLPPLLCLIIIAAITQIWMRSRLKGTDAK